MSAIDEIIAEMRPLARRRAEIIRLKREVDDEEERLRVLSSAYLMEMEETNGAYRAMLARLHAAIAAEE